MGSGVREIPQLRFGENAWKPWDSAKIPARSPLLTAAAQSARAALSARPSIRG